jgi:hypothetical protein
LSQEHTMKTTKTHPQNTPIKMPKTHIIRHNFNLQGLSSQIPFVIQCWLIGMRLWAALIRFNSYLPIILIHISFVPHSVNLW